MNGLSSGEKTREDVASLLLLLGLLVELVHRWLARTKLVDVHLNDGWNAAAVHALNADRKLELVHRRADRAWGCFTRVCGEGRVAARWWRKRWSSGRNTSD